MKSTLRKGGVADLNIYTVKSVSLCPNPSLSPFLTLLSYPTASKAIGQASSDIPPSPNPTPPLPSTTVSSSSSLPYPAARPSGTQKARPQCTRQDTGPGFTIHSKVPSYEPLVRKLN